MDRGKLEAWSNSGVKQEKYSRVALGVSDQHCLCHKK